MTEPDERELALFQTMPSDPVSDGLRHSQLADELVHLGHLREDAHTKLDVEIAATRLFGGLQPRPMIGRFEVLEVVGSGGMGVVYAARDPSNARAVAIKMVNDATVAGHGGDDAEARLAREGRVISRISHPNIVTVYEYGTHEGRVYVVMDLIDGVSLDRWLTNERRGWTEILSMFLGAGEGLASAHAAGIVHRDFKPANVLVDREGLPRVVDFGLARPIDGSSSGGSSSLLTIHGSTQQRSYRYTITATGRIGGTPAYMAPELFTGARPAASADIYAYCVSLLEASRTTADTVPGECIDMLLRGIEPDPSARWPDLRSLLDGLRDFVGARARPLGFLRALLRPKRDT